jgi:hypothetical protein
MQDMSTNAYLFAKNPPSSTGKIAKSLFSHLPHLGGLLIA